MFRDYIVLDVETTGFSTEHSKMIQLAAIRVTGGKVVDTFDVYINPGFRIPRKITELTGISNNDVQDAPYIEDIIEEFYEWCEDCMVVAHNLPFDGRFIKAACRDIGIDFSITAGSRRDRLSLCTLKSARLLYKGLDSHALGNLCSSIGVDVDSTKTHNALYDVELTNKVLENMLMFKRDSVCSLIKPINR